MTNKKWTFDKIDNLVKENAEERQTLDFKHPDALKSKKVGKIVSAFANASGGTVIYGVKEQKDQSGKVVGLDYCPVDRNDISVEWLHQKINGNIEGAVPGIEIEVIGIPDGPENEVLLVVDVPQSHTAHQYTPQRCYYRRYGDQCLKMYHHEVVDVLNRSKHPDIEVSLVLREKWEQWSLFITAENTGEVLANYVKVDLTVPLGFLGDAEPTEEGYDTYCLRNTERDVLDVEVVPGGMGPGGFPRVQSFEKYGPSWFNPLMPKEWVNLDSLKVHSPSNFAEKEITFRTYADNAAPKEGTIRIGEIPKSYEE